MSLESIIDVTITANTVTPSQAGFGTPLVAAYHALVGTNLVREYRSLAEAVADGHTSTTTVYKILQRMFQQNPRPKKIKVGKRAASTELFHFTPTATTVGLVYRITIDGEDFTYTVQGGDTVALIVDGLVLAINGGTTTVTASDGTTHLICTADATGTIHQYTDISPELTVKNQTTAGSIATELANFQAEDSDWYALVLDHNSEAVIDAAAAVIETMDKIMVAETSDTLVMDAGTTTDVGSDLAGANYARTALIFHKDVNTLIAAGWVSGRLTTQPGSDTWQFKTIRGVESYTLTSTQIAALEGKSVNYYNEVASVDVTLGGGISAAGEYMDVTRGIDWLKARIAERIFAVLVNNAKLPYTDASVDLIKGEVSAQLNIAIENNFLSNDPEPVVTAPLVADVDAADKAARFLPDVEFSATLAGAIHSLEITGILSI